MSIVLAIAAAVSFGISDVAGAVVTRRHGAGPAVLAIQVTGFPILLIAATLAGGIWSWEAVALGALVGSFGTAGFLLYMKSMAVGPIGVISPISAAVGAGVPVIWALVVVGELLTPAQTAGIAAGILAVVMVAWTPGASIKAFGSAGPVIGFAAGVLFGLSFVALDATPADSGLVPLVVGRTVGTACVFVFALTAMRSAARGSLEPHTTHTTRSATVPVRTADSRGAVRKLSAVLRGRTGLLAVVAGTGDSLAILLFLLATRTGLLSLASLLTSLYPVVALVVARYALHERLTRLQGLGVVTALFAMATLAT